MNSICRPKSFLSRAACYSAAYAYYSAVRVAGWAYFYDYATCSAEKRWLGFTYSSWAAIS
ncbi:MAG: hypothetical protein KatS3mg072_0914 [Meiothermus sp.]|nr:MAG: hypothetical protein KatS3mg072_0914 [Meiothermus sp.]